MRPTSGLKLVVTVLDSGAEKTVAPPRMFPGTVEVSAMQRAGGRYRTADGSRIPNLGQTKVPFSTAEGHQCTLLFQVARITRPLISVAQLSRSGRRCIFDHDGGYIEHRATGRKIQLERAGNTYALRMLVRDTAETKPVFSGHGR